MVDCKKYAQRIAGKPVAVFGLGKSGLSVVKALTKAGIEVLAWDDKEEARNKAEKAGAEVKKLSKTALKKCANLILAPGIPLHYPQPHEVAIAAQEAECPIIGDIELFYQCEPGCKLLALTGTNGKSTTVTLIKHVLDSCKVKATLGGNIGAPIMDTKLPPKKDGVAVLEMSSFQLDLCDTFTADIAVLLNVTPDHIDRHGTMAEYAESKSRIFKGAGQGVIGVDDEFCKALYRKLSEDETMHLIPVSVTEKIENGIYVEQGKLIDNTGSEPFEVGSLNGIAKLHGAHNHQNAAATYAALRLLGLQAEEIMEAFRSFPGLPHRQFPVRSVNGVVYINDSKATNAEATSKALANYRNIYWIVGGREKDGGLKGLERYADHITHAFLIGETADQFAKWMDLHGIEYNISHTLEIALKQAHVMAQKSRGQPGPSGVVMLSPACASYDQFENFEKRGDVFTDLVKELEEDIPA